MNKFLLTLFSLTVVQICFSQTNEKNTYTITATSKDTTLHADTIRLHVKFTNEKGQIARGKIILETNGDTLYPQIDSTGTCTVLLPLKKQKSKLHFFSKIGYDLTTDDISFKKQSVTNIIVQFETKPVVLDKLYYDLGKPAIYLYPTIPTTVNLTLGFKGDFIFTYPEYKEGWSVVAYPNGDISYKDRKYKYLFWEGRMNLSHVPLNLEEGFYVTKDSLVPFFENKLSQAGLTESEAQDFITFWIPKMIYNEVNLVHFMFTKDYDNLATLEIQPRPDNLIRVFVLWTGIEADPRRTIKPQKFPDYKRDGFTVIEWGGSELRDILKYED